MGALSPPPPGTGAVFSPLTPRKNNALSPPSETTSTFLLPLLYLDLLPQLPASVKTGKTGTGSSLQDGEFAGL